LVDGIADGLIEALDFDHRVTKAPAQVPAHFDAQYLEMARQMESDGGTKVLNPRDVSVQSLFLADADWLRDKSIHAAWVRYKYDQKRKPPRK